MGNCKTSNGIIKPLFQDGMKFLNLVYHFQGFFD